MRISFPNGEHAEVAFADGEMTIGSAAGNRVQLTTEGVLPKHAVLRIEPQRGVLLHVAAPAAAVHVNGRPVAEVALVRLGDVLSIGRVQVLLKPDDDRSIEVQVPAAAVEAVGSDSTARAAAARVVVRGVAGAFFGRSVTLQDRVLIGSEAGAAIRIDEPGFPERAASLEIHGDRVVLRDLGSADGAVVNGVPVRDAVMHPGDQVAFDIHRFVIEAPGLPPRGTAAPSPAAGAHVGTTQTMRAVKAEPPTPRPPPEDFAPEQRAASIRRGWMWLLVAALVIAGGLAAAIWSGMPASTGAPDASQPSDR